MMGDLRGRADSRLAGQTPASEAAIPQACLPASCGKEVKEPWALATNAGPPEAAPDWQTKMLLAVAVWEENQPMEAPFPSTSPSLPVTFKTK